MATPEYSPRRTPQEADGYLHDIAQPPILNPPIKQEGFLNANGKYTLPPGLEIISWTNPKTETLAKIGLQETSYITLADDSHFVFRETIPSQQLWDIKVDFTLPLSTRVKGFNTYLARKLAERGIASRIIGTNQAHGFSLHHDALATLHILNENDRFRKEQADVYGEKSSYIRGQSAMTGYSMGAMKLLLELGLAKDMGRDVVFSIGLDPCLANAVDYDEQLRDLPGLVKYLGREALELPRIAVKNALRERRLPRTLRRIRHFAETMGVTYDYFANTYDKWNVLATGETGRYLGDVPSDAVLILHFFDKSRFNDSEMYVQGLSGLPYFRPVHESGYHLSGADPDVIAPVIRKIEWGLALVKAGCHGHELADNLTGTILA